MQRTIHRGRGILNAMRTQRWAQFNSTVQPDSFQFVTSVPERSGRPYRLRAMNVDKFRSNPRRKQPHRVAAEGDYMLHKPAMAM